MSDTNQTVLPEALLNGALAIWSQVGCQQWIRLAGQSMLPLLREGDQLLVAHSCEKLRQGDLVVFRRAGKLVVHRVIRFNLGVTGRIPITKGDNVPHYDAPVQADELVGRVVQVRRGARLLSLDNRVWRVSGWLIARVTAAGIGLRKRMPGGVRLKRLALRALDLILWRWGV